MVTKQRNRISDPETIDNPAVILDPVFCQQPALYFVVQDGRRLQRPDRTGH